MRPVSLSFSGLRSYPGSSPALDFTGKSRVGIVGDTGAGKSTLLEAITLALYGTASWDQKEVKGLIADSAQVMRVDLTFCCHDQTWRVQRRYHRGTTPSTHLLENLDTGEKVDDRRPVDKRIVELLRLTFKEFQATVLLPQGRFDQLLHATGTQRIELLEGIFGTRELDAVRNQADQHRQTINDLLGKAEVRRARLLADPAAEHEEQRGLAGAASARADRVHSIYEQMMDLQRRAQTVHAADSRLSAALGSLTQAHADLDLTSLPDIAQAEADIAEAEAECTRTETSARSHAKSAQDRLTVAAQEGVTAESLSVADAYLTELPGRLEILKADRESNAAEQVRLDTEEAGLHAARTQCDSLAGRIAHLEDQAALAKKLADAAAAATSQALNGVREAISSAHTVSTTNASHAQAREDAHRLRTSLPDLERLAAARQRDAEKATKALIAHQRADAAHTAASGLSSGDPCTICARPLPDDYQTPLSTNPEEIAAAEDTAQRALREAGIAEATLTTARASIKTADQEAARASRQASADKQILSDALATILPDHDAERVFDGDSGFVDLAAFRASLAQATADICLQKPISRRTTADRRRDATLTDDLCRPLSMIAEQRADHANRKLTEKFQADAEAKATTRRLQDRAEALTRDRGALAGKVRACAAAEAHLTKVLTELPPDVRVLLPGDVAQITDEHVEAAAAATEVLSIKAQRDTAALNEANEALAAAKERRADLVQERDTRVSDPLQPILQALADCAAMLRTCRVLLDDLDLPELLRPDAVSSTTVSSYAEAVIASTQHVFAALKLRRKEGSDDLNRYSTDLDSLLAQIREAIGDHDHQLPDIVSPLDPAGVAEVAACVGMLRQQARHHEHRAQVAASQIDTARQLDEAIATGTQRQTVLNGVHGLLSEGKFVRYLIERRTHALLHVGTHVFHQLTRGELGFTDDFRIVNRRTGATRTTKTLSGGESFLASLALALALVELHSRNGARLGSLFLDEGFGALDTATLDTALNVLRDHSGGDKLVTVISHLHAVAEAVDDVLLVERSPTGSTATWLTPDQRDALIFGQAASGLLAMAGHEPHEGPH